MLQHDYDRLHHMLRAEHYASQVSLQDWEVSLWLQSREAIAKPKLARGSVDMSDTEYLKVLDRYAETIDGRETLPFIKSRPRKQSMLFNFRAAFGRRQV